MQLRTGYGALESYHKNVRIQKKKKTPCGCGQTETAEHLLKDHALCESGHEYLRKFFAKFGLSALVDTKNGFEAVVKFLDSIPYLLNWLSAQQYNLPNFYRSAFLLKPAYCYDDSVDFSLSCGFNFWRTRRHRSNWNRLVHGAVTVKWSDSIFIELMSLLYNLYTYN